MNTRSPRKSRARYTKGGRWSFAAYDNRPTFSLATSKVDSAMAAVLLSQKTATTAVPSCSSTEDFFCSPIQKSNVITPNAVLHSLPDKSQPKLRRKKKSQWEKVDIILEQISDEFRSLGDFMKVLFYRKSRDTSDERSPKHRMMVSAFLSGRSTVGMGEVIGLIYNHSQSQPSQSSKDFKAPFSHTTSYLDIKYARPCLSTWATQLVGDQVSRECHALTENDPKYPDHLAQIRPSSQRKPGAIPVTWDDIGKFNIKSLAVMFKHRAALTWYLTERMAAKRKNGITVLKRRRPHPIVQVGAISSFVMTRNRYANGYLGLVRGIWEFATKAHVDIKRVSSRFGDSVSDTTVRNFLNSLSGSSLSRMRDRILEGLRGGEMIACLVLDNIQEWSEKREQGIGRRDHLITGTAATVIFLEDCAPGAWDLRDHLLRIVQQNRCTLDVHSLYDSIDWHHAAEIQALHFARILASYVPQLAHMSKAISSLFRSDFYAKHRMRDSRGKTMVQPLGTNAEKEVENTGMMRALVDFQMQMGLSEGTLNNTLLWVRGDGASIGTMARLKKYSATNTNHFKAFRNLITSMPEIWHTRATALNAAAVNHYGGIGSKDPSSLSKSGKIANVKRPANLKKCNFYPTASHLMLCFETRVLDCFRTYFDADNLLVHFGILTKDNIPSIDKILEISRILVRRYASQDAYNQALSKAESVAASVSMKVPLGKDVTPLRSTLPQGSTAVDDPTSDESDDDIPEDAPAEDDSVNPLTAEMVAGAEKVEEKTPFVEDEAFDGDRVLANEALFLMEAGHWVEAAYAIPEGDIGRMYEILLIWIFNFTGTSNHNYSGYLLEMYCMLKYEASKDLENAIFNNWLVNMTGEPGKWIEGDLLQEHYNRWLEDMVTKKGGSFDDPFYRKTLAPNVNHFLRIKEDVEAAMELTARTKTHTSPHQRNEFHALLAMYKEDELHKFVSKRSLGHKAINTFELGYSRLEQGRISEFLKASTSSSDILCDVLQMTGVKPIPRPCSMTVPELGMLFETLKVTEATSALEGSVPPSPSLDANTTAEDETLSDHDDDDIDPQMPDVDLSEDDICGDDAIEDHLVSGSDYAATIDPETGVYSVREGDESSEGSEPDTEMSSEEEDVLEEADEWSAPDTDGE